MQPDNIIPNKDSTSNTPPPSLESRAFQIAFIPPKSTDITQLWSLQASAAIGALVADQPISRRQLLPNLLAAITLGRLALSGASIGAVPEIREYAPTIPPPYGPPERTAIIDKWITRLDETLITLEKYYGFLIEARGLAPAEVDGVQLVNLENEVHRICDHMVGCIDCDCENSIITAATGRGSGPVCVEAELTSDSHTFDRDFWQREVDAVSEDHPHERARLQGLLNAKYAGVL